MVLIVLQDQNLSSCFCCLFRTTEIIYFFSNTTLTSDWKARADTVHLLKRLKKELTILVVSHDLKLSIVLPNITFSYYC